MTAKKKSKPQVKKEETIKFPESVLAPVRSFLIGRLKTLKKQKRNLKEEDPFSNSSRVDDNAALDTEAEEQFGHARTSAIRSELDKRIIQVRKALTRVKVGKYGICENCGNMIDTDRLMVYPEATLCITCEKKR